MKHAVVIAALLALSPVAHAESWFQFEAGAGVAIGTKTGDGIYYSQGFSHSTPTDAPAWRVGFVFNAVEAAPHSFVPGVRAHLSYFDFGKVNWTSMNPQDAADFSQVGQFGGYNSKTQTCNAGNCGTMREFDSTGRITAAALTVEPYWNIGRGWSVGVEAGPALYRASWTSIAIACADGRFGPTGTRETLQRNAHWQIGGIAGVSLTRGNFSLRYNYLYARGASNTDGNNLPSGMNGEHSLMLTYRY